MPKKLSLFQLVVITINLFIIGALVMEAPSNITNTFFGIEALMMIVKEVVK